MLKYIFFGFICLLTACASTNTNVVQETKATKVTKVSRGIASVDILDHCYVREYSAAHLAAHSGQLVRKVVVGLYRESNTDFADRIRIKFFTKDPIRSAAGQREAFSEFSVGGDCNFVTPPFKGPSSLSCNFQSEAVLDAQGAVDLKETLLDKRNKNYLQVLKPISINRFSSADLDNAMGDNGDDYVSALKLADDELNGEYQLNTYSNLTSCAADLK